MDKELPISPWPEWKIISKIGEGSFGRVYKAQRTEKGRSFYSAIKIITIPASKGELDSVRSESGDEKSVRDYFENLVEECIQEVSTMEYFRGNSHIVSVEDYKVMEYLDEIGWDIFIRMEHLTSFMEYYAGKNLTEKEVMKLGIDLCKALEYCGQLHIIHRDIKPENIFVSRFGDFKLGDFGIARELEKTMSTLSKKGTYSYMAPEMYRGEKYDNRVDIYALGLVLYKLMNHNRLPFLNLEKQLITYRDKENALTRRMSGEKPPAPADAGEAFGEVILKACAYDSEERYQTPGEFREALEAIQYGTRVQKKSGKTAKPVQKEAEERYVPESMPKFLQEGAVNQLARTSQINTEAVREARRNYVQKSKAARTGQYSQQDNPSVGMSGQNRVYNTAQDSERKQINGSGQNAAQGSAQTTARSSVQNGAAGSAQNTVQNSSRSSSANSQKPVSGRTTPGNESRSVSQPKRQGQQKSSIRRTGAVQPKVTTIEELENSRDQDLREWKDPVSDSIENKPERKNRKGFFRMIITAVVVITLIGGILVARNVLETADGRNQAPAEADDSDALNSGNFGTTDSTDKSFTQAMETIREHATTIEEALDSYKREGTEGERLRFYNPSGEVAKVLVYPDQSSDGVYEEYFYWGEQMFYTYVWNGDEKQYFYYQDGLLIRWIDKDGKVHDKESDNDKYVELGDKYWSNSVVELQQ